MIVPPSLIQKMYRVLTLGGQGRGAGEDAPPDSRAGEWDIRFTLSNYSLQEFGNYVSLRGIKGLAFTCLGSMSKWEPVTFQESLSFVKKVKARDYMLYISLLDVLNRNDQIPLQAYSELSLLFQHHEDLLAELSKFRPLPCPNNVYTHGSIWMIIFLMPFLLLSLVLALRSH
ncbi:hypothetical protein ZEAMMB73_Zm00001d045951 [Zea mays]|uniref:Uncharacterized protein n=3 Tax=Zea mays TaxID=4577 RepID=A0A1D6P021_MAIZE|nr:hypothetical protein ZEAMMB73_Zm00001d045951 [Zea mays]